MLEENNTTTDSMFSTMRQSGYNCSQKDCPEEPRVDLSTSSPVSSTPFESEVFSFFRIVGAAQVFAGSLHLIKFGFSGCTLVHESTQKTKHKSQESLAINSGWGKKCYSFFVISLMCVIVFCMAAIAQTFLAFIITFAFVYLHWVKLVASNLGTVYWAGNAFSRLLSTVLSNFIEAKTLLSLYLSVAVGTAVIMAFTIDMTSVSLWLGVFVIATCVGSRSAAVLCVGKNETPHIGVLSSATMTVSAGGRAVGPLIVGYLLDNANHMWFVYICIVYASVALIFFGIFLVARHLLGKQVGKEEREENVLEELNISK